MRILTVRQPWAHAIMHLGKTVENRSRNIAGDYRGPLAIHASKSIDVAALDQVAQLIETDRSTVVEIMSEAPLGAIIGVVDLVDVHRGQEENLKPPTCWREADCVGWVPWDRDYDNLSPRVCSPWAETGGYHLELANPRPLTTPIPYRGALGLRTLNPNTIHQITNALAAVRKDNSR